MWLIDSCVHVKGLSQMHKDTSHLISHFRLCNKRFKICHLGPAQWRKWLKVLAFHARDPIWAPVLIPAAPLPFQLPACGLGRQSRTAQGFGTLHPRGRPARGSWLRIGIVSARCAHLGSESSDGRSSSLSLLSVYPPFQ